MSHNLLLNCMKMWMKLETFLLCCWLYIDQKLEISCGEIITQNQIMWIYCKFYFNDST